MGVTIGSARIDERGKATGGQAGDQTGKEVSTQAWYRHGKGWRVFRPKYAEKANKIAECMRAACRNNHIGYDQAQRNTLYNAAKPYDYDVSQVTRDVETDCSALVRVCCAYAGIMLPDFITSSEPSALLKSGEFFELTGDKYTEQSAYLCPGDILVTKTKGHTAVVLTRGDKADDHYIPKDAPDREYTLGERILRNGCVGDDVAELQARLIALGYSCGAWGADGEYGDATELAVREFQIDHECEVDGVCGPETLAAIDLGEQMLKPGEFNCVEIVGGNCYARSAPNTDAHKMGVCGEYEVFAWQGVTSDEGWQLINYKNQNAWVSGKYGKLRPLEMG